MKNLYLKYEIPNLKLIFNLFFFFDFIIKKPVTKFKLNIIPYVMFTNLNFTIKKPVTKFKFKYNTVRYAYKFKL